MKYCSRMRMFAGLSTKLDHLLEWPAHGQITQATEAWNAFVIRVNVSPCGLRQNLGKAERYCTDILALSTKIDCGNKTFSQKDILFVCVLSSLITVLIFNPLCCFFYNFLLLPFLFIFLPIVDIVSDSEANDIN